MTHSLQNSLTEVLAALRSSERLIVTCHIHPDADAVGSSTALTLGLLAMGKHAELYIGERVSEKYGFMLAGVPRLDSPQIDDPFTLVVVDTASKKRLSPGVDALFPNASSVVVIDHHISNDHWGDFNFISPAAAASAEIIFDFLELAAVPLSASIADRLYAGLSDDTGSFRFSNVTARSFEIAAALVRAGVQPAVAAMRLYFSVPERVMRLRARALQDAVRLLDGDLIVTIVDGALLDELGAEPDDTEGIVDDLRCIDGPRFVAFFRQLDDGWKASIRSKDDAVDVSQFASQFGGGGHRAAAGYKTTGDRAAIIVDLESKLRAFLGAIE